MACLSLLDYLGELGGAARLGWAGALLLGEERAQLGLAYSRL